MRRIGLAVVVTAALLGGCTSSTPPPAASPSASVSVPASPTPSATTSADPLAAYYGQHLSWSPCNSGFQCATLTVPLDYAAPAGPTIGIKVTRLPTSGPGPRIGSLILNPGGPGGSGIDYAQAATDVVSPQVRAHYDIVGFDPRGVGASDPIHCLTGPETDQLIAVNGDPTTPSQVAAVVAESAVVGRNCASRNPTLVKLVGTPFVARDLDILRAALGDSKLYYLGKSYGTFLGATYAELFPTRVGRVVLDGAVDPSLSADQLAYGQALGFELALRRFVADCLKQSDCPLSGSVDAGLARIRSFLNGLADAPLQGAPGRPLLQSLAVTGIISSLYDATNGWPALRQALTSAFGGDGSALLQIVDFYTQRNANGTFANNGTDALYAVDCIDRPDTTGPERTAVLAAQWAKVAPTFGSYLAWGNLPCYNWPVAPTDQPHRITAPGAPPILVVGTQHDPATPYPWAVSLASQLSRGVLLTWTGDGHTAYRLGSTCIDSAVDAYFLNGTTPPAGTVCN